MKSSLASWNSGLPSCRTSAPGLSQEPVSGYAHHLQRLAQYEPMQAQQVWVLQVHHDGHLSQKVPQLCAHSTFGSHPERLDSH